MNALRPRRRRSKLTHLRESLAAVQSHTLRADSCDAGRSSGPRRRGGQYATILQKIAGSPPVVDLVHLGLGPDGHTASLVPGDPVLNITDADVSVTDCIKGRRRMTLTYPILNRSRQLLWVVTGTEKAEMVGRLRAGDTSIPAGRIRRENALLSPIMRPRAALQRIECG